MKPTDYISGNGRGREAHDLEAEAMRDAFLAEALDGLEAAEGDHAAAVERLRRRIAERTAAEARRRRQPVIRRITAIAAAVTLIFTAGYLTLRHAPTPGSNPYPAQTLTTNTPPLPTRLVQKQEPKQAQEPKQDKPAGKSRPDASKQKQPRTDKPAASKTVSGNSNNDIREVVVTAYGSRGKSQQTGSVRNGESAPSRGGGEAYVEAKHDSLRYFVNGMERRDLAGIEPDQIVYVRPHETENSIDIVTRRPDKTEVIFDGPDEHAGELIEVPQTPREDDRPFLSAGTMPSFMGGDFNDFRRWVQQRIHTPQTALENGISGRVVASFTIDTLGCLTDIRILQTPDRLLADEVVRVLKTSPRWEPGRQRDRKVKLKYTIPVDFGKRQTAATASRTDTVDMRVNRKGKFTGNDTGPAFQKGGIEAFQNWVEAHITKEPAGSQNLQSLVVVCFTVDTQGRVTDIRTLKSPGKRYTDEVESLLRTAPRWTPAQIKGQKVAVKFTMAVDFRTQN